MPTPTSTPAPSSPSLLFGKYELGRLLGCGAFAKVYYARNTHSNQSVALKILSKHKLLRSGLSPHHVKREITAMQRLDHPHVLRLLEVLATRTKIYLVLEFAKGGELFTRISSRGRLSEEAARPIFQQLISALSYSHSRGVFHRDLKPENILLDDQGRVKISDFGLVAVNEQLICENTTMHETLCGTPAYVAPEILARQGYDPAKADLWSCGVILFVLVAGYLPFNDPNLMTLYRKIYQGQFRCPRWTSPELRNLLSRLLNTDPSARITIDEIMDDEWFKQGLDIDAYKALACPFRHDIDGRINKIDVEDRDLNAFDIISMSNSLNLGGLFNSSSGTSTTVKERFLSSETAEVVMERTEEAAEGMKVRRRRIGQTGGRAGIAVEWRTGRLAVWVEVFRLNRSLVLVEVETGGLKEDELFWTEKLGPVLRGSVSEPVSPVCRQDELGFEEMGSTRSV